MKCKQVEQMLIEDNQNELDANTKSKFEKHLSHCSNCMGFKQTYNIVHSGLKNFETPSPSEELELQTKALCMEMLSEQNELILYEDQNDETITTPITVWIAFVALLVLTLMWVFPLLNDFIKNQEVTRYTFYLIMIVFQNILTLMFAPILLRAFRTKKNTYLFLMV